MEKFIKCIPCVPCIIACLSCPNPCAWKVITGGVLTVTVGATGDATFGVTGLKSIAFGNVGDNAAGVDIVIAPLVTIRGLILALI